MNNPLKLIDWVDEVGCGKVAVMKLFLAITEKAQPNENKSTIYLENIK